MHSIDSGTQKPLQGFLSGGRWAGESLSAVISFAQNLCTVDVGDFESDELLYVIIYQSEDASTVS